MYLTTGPWFSPGPPVSSTNKTDRHDITEILLKVALNAINKPTNHIIVKMTHLVNMLQEEETPAVTFIIIVGCNI
jgi:hypothetical protein